MKKNRLIFYLVFGALHLFIFFFSLYMDNQKDNVQFLIKLQGKIWMLKYGSLILLGMFGFNIILHIRDIRRHKREREELDLEMNTLKAKMFDIQEEAKAAQTKSEDAPQ